MEPLITGVASDHVRRLRLPADAVDLEWGIGIDGSSCEKTSISTDLFGQKSGCSLKNNGVFVNVETLFPRLRVQTLIWVRAYHGLGGLLGRFTFRRLFVPASSPRVSRFLVSSASVVSRMSNLTVLMIWLWLLRSISREISIVNVVVVQWFCTKLISLKLVDLLAQLKRL